MVLFLWRFDKDWRGCRIETPWIKMPPSEYVKRNIRFTTQPQPKNIKLLAELMMEIEDSLLFSSDYPHWDKICQICLCNFCLRSQGLKSSMRMQNPHLDSKNEFNGRLA